MKKKKTYFMKVGDIVKYNGFNGKIIAITENKKICTAVFDKKATFCWIINDFARECNSNKINPIYIGKRGCNILIEDSFFEIIESKKYKKKKLKI